MRGLCLACHEGLGESTDWSPGRLLSESPAALRCKAHKQRHTAHGRQTESRSGFAPRRPQYASFCDGETEASRERGRLPGFQTRHGARNTRHRPLMDLILSENGNDVRNFNTRFLYFTPNLEPTLQSFRNFESQVVSKSVLI